MRALQREAVYVSPFASAHSIHPTSPPCGSAGSSSLAHATHTTALSRFRIIKSRNRRQVVSFVCDVWWGRLESAIASIVQHWPNSSTTVRQPHHSVFHLQRMAGGILRFSCSMMMYPILSCHSFFPIICIHAQPVYAFDASSDDI